MKYKFFPYLIGLILLTVIVLASFPAPAVLQIEAGEMQNKVTFNAPFTVHFSQIMNRDSVERSFQIMPKTEGTFKWKDLKTLEFYPDSNLTIEDQYRIILKGEAKSIWMKKIGHDVPIEFLVTGPPYVLFAHPTQDAVLKKDGTITVMFDRPMDWKGKESKDLIFSVPPTEGDIRFMGMSAFQFKPKKPEMEQNYIFTIPAGLKALDGGITKEDFLWSISTPSLRAEENHPANGASGVAGNEPIKIRFNGPVELAGIKPGVNALLFPSNDLDADKDRKMDGFFNTEVTYALNDKGEAVRDSLVFTPTFDYQPGEKYRFVLKSDADLHLEEDFELLFETVAYLNEDSVSEEPGLDSVQDSSPSGKLTWKREGLEFFVRGDLPRLELERAPEALSFLSVCQISSNQFMRISAEQGWKDFECDGNPVSITPVQKNDGLSLNLNDHFPIEWVTGVYFARLSQADETITKLFLVEDSTLLLKRSAHDLFVWALDTKSGSPIASMELEILDFRGDKIGSGKTDESGIFSTKESFDEGIYVRGQKEGDLSRWALVSDQWLLDSAGLFPASDDSHELYLILNQKEFFPGDTLSIKGIWRTEKDHVLALPDSTQATFTLEDSRGNYMLSKRVPLRRNGSFDSSMELPADSLAGEYFVTISDLNHQKLSDSIPIVIHQGDSDLTLEWTEAKDSFESGTTPIFIVKARYKNGIPAAGLKADFRLYRKPFSLNYESGALSYSFGLPRSSCIGDCNQRSLIGSEDFEFDLNGEAKLLLTDGKNGFLPEGYLYDLYVSSSLEDQEIMNLNHSFKIHKGTYDLGLGLKHALIEFNESIEASLITLNHQGILVPDRKVRVSLYPAKGAIKELYSETFESGLQPVSFSVPVNPEFEDGIYLLHAESQDEKNNLITAELPVYLIGTASSAIRSELMIVADQPKYFVGGRAHLIINEPSASESSPVPVVVSYERENGLLGYEALSLTAPVTKLAIPITESMLPNFVASVSRYNRGVAPSFSSASQKIEVGRDESIIFVDIDYDPSTLIPGEEFTVNLFAYDFQNRPLSCVLSLNVLDSPSEAVSFSYSHFFPSQPLPLKTASNISLKKSAFLSDPPERKVIDLIPPGRSVYFNPLITTSESGKAEVKFKLPDERQDLFIQAIATKDSKQFGSQKLTLKMNQKLQILPILPSFVSPGDQTIFGASIKNISDSPLQSRLKIISPDAVPKGDVSRNFSLLPGQQTEITFNVLVNHSIDQDSIVVRFESEEDAVFSTLPLRHLKSTERVLGSGLMDSIWTGRILLPKAAYAGLGHLRLLMSASPMTTVKAQAEFLQKPLFESTFSLTARLLVKLFLLSPDDEEERLSAQGMIASLFQMADEKGGYHFWNESAVSAPLSAMVLLAFSEARLRGLTVDTDSMNRTFALLWKALDQASDRPNDELFILWVLSEHGQHDTKKTLDYFQMKSELSVEGKAFLLLTLDRLIQAGQKSTAPLFETLKAELTDEAFQDEFKASFGNSAEATAIVLFALNRLDSDNPLLELMANYLSAYNKPNLSPREALWSLMALSHYSQEKIDVSSNFIAQVKLNGALLMDHSFTAAAIDEVYETTLPAKILYTNDVNDLFLKKEGGGSLYFDAFVTFFLDPSKVLPLEEGIVLLRQLYEVNDQGELKPVGTPKKGKQYVSHLELIVPRDHEYVLLTDTIPAGMKAVSDSANLDFPFSHRVTSSDEIRYFAPLLPAGVYRIETPLQALVPGVYQYFPATIQSMFEPEFMARTEGGTMQIID